jgi:hypothetical protein
VATGRYCRDRRKEWILSALRSSIRHYAEDCKSR